MKTAIFALGAAVLIAGCSPADETPETTQSGVLPAGPVTESAAVDPADLPPALTALIQATIPGMTVSEVERKEREGRIYFDVEGARPDGSEVELDIQQIGDRFEVVEIQRDIAFADMPEAARTAAQGAPGAFEPARIIESRQTDESVIYELFAPDRTDEPAMEVRVRDGKAEVLTERWAH